MSVENVILQYTEYFVYGISFSSPFHVISWKFGLLFGQCKGDGYWLSQKGIGRNLKK